MGNSAGQIQVGWSGVHLQGAGQSDGWTAATPVSNIHCCPAECAKPGCTTRQQQFEKAQQPSAASGGCWPRCSQLCCEQPCLLTCLGVSRGDSIVISMAPRQQPGLHQCVAHPRHAFKAQLTPLVGLLKTEHCLGTSLLSAGFPLSRCSAKHCRVLHKLWLSFGHAPQQGQPFLAVEVVSG